MNKFKKLSQNLKKVATIALASCTFALAFAGIPLFNAYAEATEGTQENGLKYTALDTGVNQVVHYEFQKGALGKDSLGHYDLNVGTGVFYDEVNGGVAIGDSTRTLWTSASNDFSDLVSGDYMVSTRVHLASAESASNYLFSTGSYNNGSKLDFGYEGITLSMNGAGEIFKSTTTGTVGIGRDFAWYRITIIYDQFDEALVEGDVTYLSSVKVLVTKEGDASFATKELTKNLTVTPSFKGNSSYVFRIGAGHKDNQQPANFTSKKLGVTVYPNMSDFRVYTGEFTEQKINAELAAIAAYDTANLANAKTEAQALAATSDTVGATLRLTENSGLRFLSTIDENTVNSFKFKYGADNVSFGTKLVRDHNGEKAYAYVPATNTSDPAETNGVYNFNSVITELTEDYYGTNFTAQVYVKVSDTEYILSGEEKTRSISEVAQMALADLYEVDVDGTLAEKPEDYKYEIEPGVWSPYHQTTRDKLAVYVVE